MQSGQTSEGVRLRQKLQNMVDEQLQRFRVEVSDQLARRRNNGASAVANWLWRNAHGPPERDEMLFKHFALHIASLLVELEVGGSEEAKLMLFKEWAECFDGLVGASTKKMLPQEWRVDKTELASVNRAIVEALRSLNGVS